VVVFCLGSDLNIGFFAYHVMPRKGEQPLFAASAISDVTGGSHIHPAKVNSPATMKPVLPVRVSA
jgi:hypothetical protein